MLLSMQSDSPTDIELIEQANRGEAAAFEALYYRYRDWVLGRAFYMTASHEDALDVLQEVFAYFFSKFPDFELRAQLKTFLYPVIRNQSLARLRKRRPTVPLDLVLEELPIVPPDSRTEDTDALNALLTPLDAAGREVVLLRFVDALSLKEISDALEIPLGTVKSRLHHALKTLREHPATEKHFL
ncbi:MAG: sigma-70 family RNA polymerase sigma factor [Planctomycetota bacterium]|nr:sigma-70 family RNA polymerase sigma factor [Planctomycetota bacterium]